MIMSSNKNLTYYKLVRELVGTRSRLFRDGLNHLEENAISIQDIKERIEVFH